MANATQILPGTGRWQSAGLTEGHVPVFLKAQMAPLLPLHQLRWSPSPFRGGIWKVPL
jgi:hypothetical protein